MTDDIASIFQRAKEGRALFLDRKALSPEYVPNHLPFRQQQITAVAEVLAPALHGSKPSNLLLYGKTGTGKTAVSRFVLSKLKAEDSTCMIFTPYINTRIAGTEYRTLGNSKQSRNVSARNRLIHRRGDQKNLFYNTETRT